MSQIAIKNSNTLFFLFIKKKNNLFTQRVKYNYLVVDKLCVHV